MKATWRASLFREFASRSAAEHRSKPRQPQPTPRPIVEAPQHVPAIGPTEMAMPGSTGIELKPQGIGNPRRSSGSHPPRHECHDQKAVLAGTAVCFISHQGEVFPADTSLPCWRSQEAIVRRHLGQLPASSTSCGHQHLRGKCGCCEFRNICMGCRARAYAATGTT